MSAQIVGAKVLLVTDDSQIGRVWAYALGEMGLEVALAGSADEAMTRWADEVFDLVLIDAHTSQLDIIDLCQRLHAEAANLILLLTPRTDEAHLLEAYQAGADECISKPISPSLFLAKVKTWLRRSWTLPTEALDALQAGDLQLDPTRRQVVTPTGSVVKLTNLEFRLLHLLMSHQGQVLDSNLIIDRVWGHTGGGDTVLLKNVVYRLRRKIEPDPSQPRYIQTTAGEGYSFQPK